MKQEEFARRRKSLVGMLQEGAIVIIANAPEKIRNRDVFYPYRPDSDFYYLTGFGEPESVAVIIFFFSSTIAEFAVKLEVILPEVL